MAFPHPHSEPFENREAASYYRQRADEERLKAIGTTNPRKRDLYLVLAEIFTERVVAAE